jgi:HAT1-interacting factor 1
MPASTTPLAPVAESDDLPKTQEKLDELTQAAALQYSLKNFAAAADHYADAVEIQAELNGEMAPKNAELLFYYGRALYKVAVAKSDVLGNNVVQEDKKKSKAKKAAKAEAAKSESAQASGSAKPAQETVESKPYFQLTGDENWTDSEEEDDDDGDDEQEEDEDDFGNAYETFELARVLYAKQLDTLQPSDSTDKGKGKAELTPEARAIKEKIADCHGFLVDISLENERFHDAVADARSSLALQEELNPFEHENVTEGHYSLSLALEFASVSKVREDQLDVDRQQSVNPTPADKDKDGVDWELRNEAATHTERAIQSLEARLAKEEAALTTAALTPEQKKEKEAVIADKKSMLDDLKTRLTDLRLDPTKQDYDSLDPSVVQGLFGSLLGADAATQKSKLAEATKSANDLSGVVRKKAKAPAPAPAATPAESASSKRKLEGEADDDASGKRAKTEEAS